MKCRNCGAELLEGATFCTVCGTPTAAQQGTAGNAAEAANAAAGNTAETVNAAAPGNAMGGGMPPQYGPAQGMYGAPMPKKPRAKMSKGLRNGLIAACCAAAALVVILIVINLLPTTVSLNKYVTITESGYDGYGTAEVSFDEEAFKKDYSGKIKADKNEVKDLMSDMLGYGGDIPDMYMNGDYAVELLNHLFRGELDKSSGLSNGDEIIYSWTTLDEDAKKYFNVVFDCSDIKYTVSNLDPVGTFDAFEGVDVVFEGTAPSGTAYVDSNNNYSYSLDKSSGLSNGDTVTVTVDIGSPESFIQQYGKVPETETKTYTVEGLSSYITSVSELSAENLAVLQREAEDAVLSYGATYYEGTQSDVTYIGAYLLNRKDTDGFYWGYTNYLYLVYTAMDTATDGRYDPVLGYLPVEICDVKIDGDGNVTYSTVNGITGSTYEQLPNGFYYNGKGYIDPTVMYQDIVTSNRDDFYYDVSDSLKQFGS